MFDRFQAGSGPGLVFIAFTEAIVQMPAPHIWAILFFMMLITLGFGSMFGTLEGVVTPLFDAKIVNIKKPYITGTQGSKLSKAIRYIQWETANFRVSK